eukprot:TRINITY_DN45041_c0_g1_i1.p2 TRINITY_DN45041_c0_g1~~TRINITY_DN45041_c0_g1_i1.p2  ORF type:complete len:104 (+),score=26.04 TRINITY_DN45041_c0_g1_i1:120-431(+)
MLRSLVGSEMCIRDRYQRRVRDLEQAATTLVVQVLPLVVLQVTTATVPAPQRCSILAQHSLALLLSLQQTTEGTTSLPTPEMEVDRTTTFCTSFPMSLHQMYN